MKKYKSYLDKGTTDEGLLWDGQGKKPKSRYYTFKRAFQLFEDMNGKVIVELGTTRSFVHGGLVVAIVMMFVFGHQISLLIGIGELAVLHGWLQRV